MLFDLFQVKSDQEFNIVINVAESILPPLRMIPTLPLGTMILLSRAASPSAPDGSITSFILKNKNLTASIISSSETVFISSTYFNTRGGYLLQFFFQWLSHRPHKHYFLVTKNGKIFDIPFLFIRYVLRFGYDPLNDLTILYYDHFDLQEITSKRVGLQQMAELLGCTAKIGTGTNAIKLWKAREFEKIRKYGMQDVLTTEEVSLRWRSLQNGEM